MTSPASRHEAAPALAGLRLRLPGRAIIVRALGVAALVTSASAPANAQGLCADSFGKWVQTSETAYKQQPRSKSAQGDPPTESCLPSEQSRQALLSSLDLVRRQCEGPDGGSGAAATKPLLEINADVVASVPLCKQQDAVATPPKAISSRSCLALSQLGPIYLLSNSKCNGRKVIAVVEIRLSTGVVKCRGHVVTEQTKLGTAKPEVNYECVENGTDCTLEGIKDIFPYCYW